MNVRSYLEVIKPRMVLLLVFTALAAMILAFHQSSIPPTAEIILPAILGIGAACAGCNAITCYIDRDIDAIMTRTRNRPLPSMRINPPQKALLFGVFLIALSLTVALARNLLTFIFIAAGIIDNVFIYSLLLKRRNPVNILAGAASGGLPLLSGWSYVTNNITLSTVMMAALVIVWIPNHIWSLAIKYKDDYKRAEVPMMPVVVEDKTSIRLTVSTSILLVVFSILLYFLGVFGLVYLLTAATIGALTVFLNIRIFYKPTEKMSWIAFKFSSPYLAVIFLAMIVDVMLR